MKIESRLENILQVDLLLEKLKWKYQLDEKQFSCMLVSVNEAVTNSIRHGNQNDPSKKIEVDFVRSDTGTFIFTITDEGTGFNWKKITARLAGPKQEGQTKTAQRNSNGGRGLLIMERLADKRIFNKKGNSVALHFKA